VNATNIGGFFAASGYRQKIVTRIKRGNLWQQNTIQSPMEKYVIASEQKLISAVMQIAKG
jgi:hypothetical protein